jgi:hypothetical protein
MEEYVGAPREAAGIRTPGEKTKFEVGQLLNNAGKIFQDKINQFEMEFLEPVMNAELELSGRSLTEATAVPVNTEDGLTFEDISREDLKITGDLIAVGARHHQEQAQAVQELSNFSQVLQLDPELANHFPPQKLAEAWNSVLGFGRQDGVMEPFGRLDERVIALQRQQAAQQVLDEEAVAAEEVDNQPI